MSVKLSRRRLANHVADKVISGESIDHILTDVAAYLIESRQIRASDSVVRSIEDALDERNIVVASVASAHKLSDTQRDSVKQLFPGKQVHLHEIIQPELIGGIRVDAPGVRLDTTIQRKLTALQRAKI